MLKALWTRMGRSHAKPRSRMDVEPRAAGRLACAAAQANRKREAEPAPYESTYTYVSVDNFH